MKQSRNNKLFLFISILLIIICIYYYFNNNEHYTLSPETILNIPKPINIKNSLKEYTLKRTLNDNRPTDASMISVIRAIQNDTNKILWDIKKDRNMFQIYINNQLIQNINSTGTDSIIIGYQKLTDNKTFNLYYSINGYEKIKTSKTDSKLTLDKDHTIEFFAVSTTTTPTTLPPTTTTTLPPTTTTTTLPPTTTTTTTTLPPKTTTTTLPPTTTTTTTLPPTTTTTTTTIPPTTTTLPPLRSLTANSISSGLSSRVRVAQPGDQQRTVNLPQAPVVQVSPPRQAVYQHSYVQSHHNDAGD